MSAVIPHTPKTLFLRDDINIVRYWIFFGCVALGRSQWLAAVICAAFTGAKHTHPCSSRRLGLTRRNCALKAAWWARWTGSSLRDAHKCLQLLKSGSICLPHDCSIASQSSSFSHEVLLCSFPSPHYCARTQNGLRSIIERLGNSQEFPRIKIGIGRPAGSISPAAHVLQPFNAKERDVIGVAVQEAVDVIGMILDQGLHKAMSRGGTPSKKGGEKANGAAAKGAKGEVAAAGKPGSIPAKAAKPAAGRHGVTPQGQN
eukprot:1142668-Pelagomonas_calceolata.AAC.4